MKELFEKYKSVIMYLIFGALTTLVSVVTYALCYKVLFLPNTVSTIISWVVSVTFAFVTNKFFVFESKSREKKTVLREAASFYGCRALTGVLELVLMFLLVDILKFDGILMKILVNIIVIILNYVASKLVIFKNK